MFVIIGYFCAGILALSVLSSALTMDEEATSTPTSKAIGMILAMIILIWILKALGLF